MGARTWCCRPTPGSPPEEVSSYLVSQEYCGWSDALVVLSLTSVPGERSWHHRTERGSRGIGSIATLGPQSPSLIGQPVHSPQDLEPGAALLACRWGAAYRLLGPSLSSRQWAEAGPLPSPPQTSAGPPGSSLPWRLGLWMSGWRVQPAQPSGGCKHPVSSPCPEAEG